jgi:aspartate carbamoyltransferase
MPNSLAGNDVLSMQDLEKQEILRVLQEAERLQSVHHNGIGKDLLAGRVLAPLFYEPVPWLRSSFESAMLRLGGHVLSMAGQAESPWDSEALTRSAHIVSAHADVIVHRHPEIYSAHEAAKAARVPVVNAGDGTYERPVRALVDLYEIQKERGAIDGLSVVIVGDLRHSPAVHSLTRALAHWEVTLRLISPPSLKMAAVLTVPLKRAVSVVETHDLDAAAGACDVLYVAPMYERYLPRRAEAETLRERYCIDHLRLQQFGDDVTVLHPLPLGEGIGPQVDLLPEAARFRQAANGVWVRMALLALLLGAL